MKNFRLFTAFLALALLSTSQTQAQSLGDIFSSFFGSTPSVEKSETPKPVERYPSAEEVVGTWVYSEPLMEYTGDSSLASFAVSSAKGQLAPMAAKFGVVAGRDYISVENGGTLHIKFGDKKNTLQYSYSPSTGKVTLSGKVGDKTLSATGVLSYTSSGGKILFDANELATLAEKNSSSLKENTTFQVLKSLIDSYPGIKVGASFVPRH